MGCQQLGVHLIRRTKHPIRQSVKSYRRKHPPAAVFFTARGMLLFDYSAFMVKVKE